MKDSASSCECYEDECDPILSVSSLLNIPRNAFSWCELVEPLVERSKPRFFYNKYFSMDDGSAMFEVEQNRPEVLVCHDYKGNYLDDKFINGTPRYEEYKFYNWNCIDIFCYFSHKLVTVPTLQFLNAAHKNGVKVLGTLIVESADGQKSLYDDILSSKLQAERVANSLVELSKRLKFEGWLLNVEVAVDIAKIDMLKHFVYYLTKKTHSEIQQGKIIWYDSVTADGKLAWQNELNSRNEVFFDLSDGIFTNYNWSIQHLERTSRFVDEKYPDRRKDVFFGIDVFGRGQIAGFRSHETLSKTAAFKFSTAIFAPGWTAETVDLNIGFEGLSTGSDAYRDMFNQKFLERNDRFWSSMYDFFHIFGPKTLPFVTNFCIGSGKKFYRMGRKVKDGWFNLKLQGFQPSTPSREGFYSHHYEDAFDGGSCLSIDTVELIRLFVCELSCNDDVIFSYTFKRSSEVNDVQFTLTVLDVKGSIDVQLSFGGADRSNPFAISCLDEEDVRNLGGFLANNKNTFVPTKINGWETRYYLLKFDRSIKAVITDIGVKKTRRGNILLGQLAFYSAKDLPQQDFEHVEVIQL